MRHERKPQRSNFAAAESCSPQRTQKKEAEASFLTAKQIKHAPDCFPQAFCGQLLQDYSMHHSAYQYLTGQPILLPQ